MRVAAEGEVSEAVGIKQPAHDRAHNWHNYRVHQRAVVSLICLTVKYHQQVTMAPGVMSPTPQRLTTAPLTSTIAYMATIAAPTPSTPSDLSLAMPSFALPARQPR